MFVTQHTRTQNIELICIRIHKCQKNNSVHLKTVQLNSIAFWRSVSSGPVCLVYSMCMKLSQNATCLLSELWDMSHETISCWKGPRGFLCAGPCNGKKVEPGLEYKENPFSSTISGSLSGRQHLGRILERSLHCGILCGRSVGWTWRTPSGLSQLGLHKGIHRSVY